MRVTIEYSESSMIESIMFEQSNGYDHLLTDRILRKIIEHTVNDNFTAIKQECLLDDGIIDNEGKIIQ
mgnify:CR=1 FL=1